MVAMHAVFGLLLAMSDGALTSTTPDGRSQTSENTFGLTKFNPRSRTYTEQLAGWKSRVIAVELK